MTGADMKSKCHVGHSIVAIAASRSAAFAQEVAPGGGKVDNRVVLMVPRIVGVALGAKL